MKRLAIVVGIVTALAGVFWLWIQLDDAGESRAVEARNEDAGSFSTTGVLDGHGALTTETDSSVAKPGSSLEPVELEPDRRERLDAEAVLYGQIVSSAGQPVANAQISWTPIPPQLLEDDYSYEDLSALVPRDSLIVTSNEAGDFVFRTSCLDGNARASVLWVTHERYRPLVVKIPDRGPKTGVSIDCRLVPTTVSNVHVLHVGHGSVHAAVVRQSGLSSHLIEEFPAKKSSMSRLAWLLQRETLTNESGEARLQAMPGTQKIIAIEGGLSSTPWVGVAEDRIELTIGASIEVEGTVRIAPHVAETEVFALVLEAVRGSRVFTIEEREIASGKWGPIALPFLLADEYRARLTGQSIKPKIVRFHPVPGDRRTIDFDIEYGFAQWFYVTNVEGDPLPSADLTVWWIEGGRRVEKHAKAREDGFLVVGGLPAGLIEGQSRCPGYMPARITPLSMPPSEEVSYSIVLTRGGILRGTCLTNGTPTQDFEISVWPVSRQFNAATYRFSDPEGTFEIDGVPLGDVVIGGMSAGIGMSDPLSWRIEADGVNDVLVELVTGVRAHGRVEDFITGTPITEATVQVRLGSVAEVIADVGVPIPVNQAGEFEVDGLSRGEAQLLVSAPGYSRSVLKFPSREAEDVDLGLIRLTKQYPLEVVLLTNDDLPEPTMIELLGGEVPEVLAVQDGQTVVFEAVSPGLYKLQASLPDGSRIEKSIVMPQGQPLREVLDVTGSCIVHAEIENLGELSLADVTFWSHTLQLGQTFGRFTTFNEYGVATLTGLEPGLTRIELQYSAAGNRTTLALDRVDLKPGDEVSIGFKVGLGDRRLRIVDASGSPLQGVIVSTFLHGSALPWEVSVSTDASGECTLKSLEGDSFLVHLEHPTAGHRVGVEITEPYSDRVIELVLKGNLTVSCQLMTLEGPAAGIRPHLADSRKQHWIEGGFTDADGFTSWLNLSPGEYKILYAEPQFWPLEHSFQLHENQTSLRLQLYRRVDLNIETRTAGLPRTDVVIDLYWLEEDKSLGDLFFGKYAEAGKDKLRTSQAGVLNLYGLPQGDYKWTAETADGPLSGTMTLLSGEINRLVIEVP